MENSKWNLIFFTVVLAFSRSRGLDDTDPIFWSNTGEDELQAAIKSTEQNTNLAEAVILFIGDGFSVTTLTATRIFKGQMQGKTGEETKLSFEKFPHFGFSKTYNTNSQVPDSAGTATAYLSGVKSKRRMLGLDARANPSLCQPMTRDRSVDSILKTAKEAGMAVGFVTTTRITHASPAAAYAHTPERNWELDSLMTEDIKKAGCKDIAMQLVESDFDIDVVMGGGRMMFLPNTTFDPEFSVLPGLRQDGRNLIEEWKQRYRQKGSSKFVWNQAQFDQLDPVTTDYLLGLFDYDHMLYETDRPGDEAGEPSLAEMTEKAIRLLRRKNKRFLLFVEGGRIDHGNHLNTAYRALLDGVAFDEAVQRANEMTNKDTLIVLSSDHGHTLSFAGYPPRGHKILDKMYSDDEGLPYTALSYANGFTSALLVLQSFIDKGHRLNITNVNTVDPGYLQQALILMTYETHGGEDVAIFATGPWSHLFHSVHEQNYIPHVMMYAACIGDYLNHCHTTDPSPDPSLDPSPDPSLDPFRTTNARAVIITSNIWLYFIPLAVFLRIMCICI